MTNRQAINIAIWAMEKEVRRLAPLANLHTVYKANTPATIQAAKDRDKLNVAIEILKRSRQ